MKLRHAAILAATATMPAARTLFAQASSDSTSSEDFGNGDLKYLCRKEPRDCKQVCNSKQAKPADKRCPSAGLGQETCGGGKKNPRFCYVCDCSICSISSKQDPPELEDLSDWQPTDYVENEGLESNFLTNGLMFNSPMVIPPGEGKTLFRPDYKLSNVNFSFPRDGSSPGVPGAYPYAEGYEHWGGDEVTLGKQRYSSMISHFGHSHILTVITKMNILRRELCGDTTSQDKMLEHLLDGSKQIFAWFAGLVDSDGNPTPTPTNPMLAQLKGLMSMLIYGDGTDNGVIDLDVLFGAIQQFLQAATDGGNPNVDHLNAEAGRVNAYLMDVLNLSGSAPIPLMSWYQIMASHQGNALNNYLRYREAWSTKDDDKIERAIAESQSLIKSGSQMAAFFGVFYSFTNFLDKFYYTAVDEEYSIPVAIMDENINYVQAELKWRWIEHAVMFNDYAKAAALNDEEAMYLIQVNILDSCTPLASAIGEVFNRFDKLIRGRDVYNAPFWDM